MKPLQPGSSEFQMLKSNTGKKRKSFHSSTSPKRQFQKYLKLSQKKTELLSSEVYQLLAELTFFAGAKEHYRYTAQIQVLLDKVDRELNGQKLTLVQGITKSVGDTETRHAVRQSLAGIKADLEEAQKEYSQHPNEISSVRIAR